jgi:hypothetical protein
MELCRKKKRILAGRVAAARKVLLISGWHDKPVKNLCGKLALPDAIGYKSCDSRILNLSPTG